MTIDYREPDLVSKIKEATGDSVKYGADMIADDETKKITVQAIGPSGGKVVGLNPMQSTEVDRKDVAFSSASSKSPRRIPCTRADPLPSYGCRHLTEHGARTSHQPWADAHPSGAPG